MKSLLAIAFSLIALPSAICSAQEQNATPTKNTDSASPHPGYAQVGDDDKQMDRAVEHAQRSLGFFMAALRAKKSGDTAFEVKKAFVDSDKVEHLWIRGVTFDGKNFHGAVDNQPVEIANAHPGQRVTVAPQEVDDWMFLKNGKLMGGYTTRVLYARLSPEEKAAFDKQAEYKIE